MERIMENYGVKTLEDLFKEIYLKRYDLDEVIGWDIDNDYNDIVIDTDEFVIEYHSDEYSIKMK